MTAKPLVVHVAVGKYQRADFGVEPDYKLSYRNRCEFLEGKGELLSLIAEHSNIPLDNSYLARSLDDIVGGLGNFFHLVPKYPRFLLVVSEGNWEDAGGDSLGEVIEFILNSCKWRSFATRRGALLCIATKHPATLETLRHTSFLKSGVDLVFDPPETKDLSARIDAAFAIRMRQIEWRRKRVWGDVGIAFLAFLLFGIAQALASRFIDFVFSSFCDA